MAKRITSVYIEDAVLEDLKKEADKLDRSISWLINQAIENWFQTAAFREEPKDEKVI